MSRLSTLSPAMKAAMFSQETAKVILELIKIYGDDIATPIRLVRNTEDCTSNVEGSSNVYTAFPFNVVMPDDKDDGSIKSVSLEVDNVSQLLVDPIRSIASTSRVYVDYYVVVADSPNTKELGPLFYLLDTVNYDAQSMRLSLKYEDRMENALIGLDFNPADFPGVH